MFSTEQRRIAVETFIRFGHGIRAHGLLGTFGILIPLALLFLNGFLATASLAIDAIRFAAFTS